MAISGKTRKLLWGRSGNRCSYCRCELIMEVNSSDDHSIIGDECHIIAKNLYGPRGDINVSENDLDRVHNLILLCKVHHKMVDDQPNTFTVDILKRIKTEHERWARETLKTSSAKSEGIVQIAIRLAGEDVTSLLSQAYAYDFGHDDLQNSDEVELVGSFLQSAQDWADIASEVDVAWRVKMAFDISQDMKKLEDTNFAVFGVLQKRRLKVLNQIEVWPVAVLRVVRNTNPNIKTFTDGVVSNSGNS